MLVALARRRRSDLQVTAAQRDLVTGPSNFSTPPGPEPLKSPSAASVALSIASNCSLTPLYVMPKSGANADKRCAHTLTDGLEVERTSCNAAPAG